MKRKKHTPRQLLGKLSTVVMICAASEHMHLLENRFRGVFGYSSVTHKYHLRYSASREPE